MKVSNILISESLIAKTFLHPFRIINMVKLDQMILNKTVLKQNIKKQVER